MKLIFLYSVIFILSLITIAFTSNRLYEKYIEDDPILIDIRKTLEPVFPDINTVILLKGRKSYTINKKKIHICLKDREGKYYDKNMLVYVTLHELAHVRCDEIGHTEKFYKIFQEILELATKHKIYNPHIPIIKDYCEY